MYSVIVVKHLNLVNGSCNGQYYHIYKCMCPLHACFLFKYFQLIGQDYLLFLRTTLY